MAWNASFGCSPTTAAAATSSLSGALGPTLLGQRYCMDGGIARTWAHTDLVAGSKRALVIILINGYEGSLLLSGIPHNIHDEMRALDATGTKGVLIIAGTPSGVNLLDPKQIKPALGAGFERARSRSRRSRPSGPEPRAYRRVPSCREPGAVSRR